MKKLIVISVYCFYSTQLMGNPAAERLQRLQERMHPRCIAARTAACTGLVLMHCVRPLDRVGYLTVITALALQRTQP